MIENKQNRICKVHNARFYALAPRSINYLAYNQETSKLALSREDASIEIWDTKHAPHLERVIPGSSDSSIESLGWAHQRLFSTGLTGELIEYDLQTLESKRKLLLTGNAAWCLDVDRQNKHLTVGTEGGYLNLFDVSIENEVNYVKIFDKQEGKILCCKFDHTGEFIVTGSADTIRIWELQTGHAMFKMTVGRTDAKKETHVWSLCVLKNFSIIAGDSRGYVTVWDGKLAAQQESIQTIKSGAVLSIAVSDDEKTFVCAGVDAKIKAYSLMEVKKEDKVLHKWVKFIQRHVHEHDVKAVTFVGNRVFSGSVDGYLGTSYVTKSKKSQHLAKFGPFLQQPCAVVAESSRILLLKYVNYIELWRLGVPTENAQIVDGDDASKGKKFLSLEEGVEKLVELRSNNDLSIITASISSDAKYLVYSTQEDIRLFQLTCEKSIAVSIKRLKSLPDKFTPSMRCVFSPDAKSIFLVKNNRDIDIFTISPAGSSTVIQFKETISSSAIIKDLICNVEISSCGSYLVCAGLCSNIAVWKLETQRKKSSWKHLLDLPKHKLPPTAIAIRRNSPKLVAAFADSTIYEYDLDEMKFVCNTSKEFVENQSTHIVRNIVLDPRNENIFILHNDSFMFVLQKSETVNESPKRAKQLSQSTTSKESTNLVLKTEKYYEHLVSLSWIGASEMVAVGVNPVTLLDQLPPVFRVKQFGLS